MRVHVFDGDYNELGFGNLVGWVTIYALDVPEEGLILFDDPEVRPTEHQARDMRARIITIERQPKIVMDDGTVYYGRQVHWREAHDPALN